jgi:hypothetical protein
MLDTIAKCAFRDCSRKVDTSQRIYCCTGHRKLEQACRQRDYRLAKKAAAEAVKQGPINHFLYHWKPALIVLMVVFCGPTLPEEGLTTDDVKVML